MHSISEERKKIETALDKSLNTIKKYEEQYNLSSNEFIKKFQKNAIPETADTFQWWAELKILKELENKLNLVDSTEISQ